MTDSITIVDRLPDGSDALAGAFDARHYHSGQSSRLYMLTSSGKVDDIDALAAELRDAIGIAEKDDEPDARDHEANLTALLAWVERDIEREKRERSADQARIARDVFGEAVMLPSGEVMRQATVLHGIKDYVACALNGDAGSYSEAVPHTWDGIVADLVHWLGAWRGDADYTAMMNDLTAEVNARVAAEADDRNNV